VTLILRFGSALNLKVHFHMLFMVGVYTTIPWAKSRSIIATTRSAGINSAGANDQHRVAGSLEREGILERDE
jgi:hypothetical protein